MAIDKIFKSTNLDDVADNILSEVDDFVFSVDKMQQRKVAGNVQKVVQAFRQIETELQKRYDNVTDVLEKRITSINDGRDGLNGTDGRSGRDGKPGRDGVNGKQGPPGTPGKDGIDGVNGVSVTNANIDFDGSLVISLSSGEQINVGEVVPPELERQLVELRQGGSAGSSGDVMGPTSSTDNAIARFDGTTGKLVQNSVVTIADTTGNMTGVGTLTTTGNATIQGVTVGLGAGAVAQNTAVGLLALAGSNTGTTLTALGYGTLNSNTSGVSNTAVGHSALVANTTGGRNTAVGASASVGNTTGASNVALGYTALFTNTTGGNNTAIGDGALTANTTAPNNTAVGYQASYSNTTGTSNTTLGYQAGYTGTTSLDNTFVGYQAGYGATTGTGRSVAVGRHALYTASTGIDNTAVGYFAGKNTTTGSSNAFFGGGVFGVLLSAGNNNTTGSNNTALGAAALGSNTTSGNSTAVGYSAGYLATGIGNQFFGYNSGSAVTTGAKNVILGSYTGSAVPISATGSNYIILSDGDGNVRQTIDSNGNVGIGTTAPLYKLQISGTSNTVGVGIAGTVASGDIGIFYNPSAITGSYSFISGSASATTGTGVNFTNSNSASATAHSAVNIQTTGASGGDPKLTYTISGVLNWSLGVDNSDSDKFKISGSDSPGSSDYLTIDTSGNVGIGTSSPNASAILDAQSTTKGVRMPNMTTTQKNAIASPAAGLMVFDTTLAKLCVYTGAAWQTITSV